MNFVQEEREKKSLWLSQVLEKDSHKIYEQVYDTMTGVPDSRYTFIDPDYMKALSGLGFIDALPATPGIAKGCTVQEGDFYWVTFNPKEGADVSVLDLMAKHIRNAKWCNGVEYCYDVRSTRGDLFEGLHAHMICHVDISLKNVTAHVARTLHGLPRGKERGQIIKYSNFQNKEYPYGRNFSIFVKKQHNGNMFRCPANFLEGKRAYLRGEKLDEGEKQEAKDATKLFRDKAGYKDIYVI